MENNPKQIAEIINNPEQIVGNVSDPTRASQVQQSDKKSERGGIWAEIAEIKQRIIDGEETPEDARRLDDLVIEARVFGEVSPLPPEE